MPRRARALRISWQDDILSVSGSGLPAQPIRIHYLEAFCRPGSHAREWSETVIPHHTVLLSKPGDGARVHLKSTLEDGVVVRHTITAGPDEVDFRLSAYNPTPRESAAHWAQPCVSVGAFSGLQDSPDPDQYIRKCFVFLSGALSPMPTPGWATSARYTPGQVWCPASVPRSDVNPRPLNPLIPSNGLIGCFSRAGDMVLATAWEPYQELLQGVFHCIHADFRIGGLRPGQHKRIRGKLYIVKSDIDALLERYQRDFPEHDADGAARGE